MKKENKDYKKLFARNEGCIFAELQQKIRNTQILIAGCGIGSTIAGAAVRMGFENLILANGDIVDLHNLNRQAFCQSDIGHFKTKALTARLKSINPNCSILEYTDWITPENAKEIILKCDLVFDTINFLDLSGITAVHDEAHTQRKPLVSVVSADWGGAAIYFPADANEVCGFRKLFSLPDTGSVENKSSVKHFKHFIERISTELDPAVAMAAAKALTVMEDGTPCPAPHVSAGSFAVASLAATIAARILNGAKVTAALYMLIANMNQICVQSGIDLTPSVTTIHTTA